jgi:hypothetical protein
MLSLTPVIDASRMRSGMGTWLGCGSTPVPCGPTERLAGFTALSRAQGSAMPFGRPQAQARKAVYLLGYDAQAAAKVQLTEQQRTSNVQNAHTKTRIAARITEGGGHLGPHPARDPV